MWPVRLASTTFPQEKLIEVSIDTARSKPCIIMAIGALRGGGAERVVLNLINHWPDDRYRPVLLLANRSGPYLADVKAGVEVLSCDVPFRAIDTPRALLRIGEIMKRLQPAAVFAHAIGTGRMLARARALGLLSAPLFMVLHANVRMWLEDDRQRKMARWLLKRELGWMYSRADGVIAVSRGAAEELKSLFPGKISEVETIYNPIDLEQIDAAVTSMPSDAFVSTFMGLPRPTVLTVGRLSPEKNQALLLRAYARLPQGSRGSLVILGEGDTRAQLESLARELGIESETHFPGFVPNPWWYMQRADLYVLPSRSEAYPMVLVEALACGLPVVATDCRHGPSEIIQSESFGTLVPVDDPQALAVAMDRRLQSANAGPRFREDIRAFLESYRPEKVAQRYDELVFTRQGGYSASLR